MYESERVRVLHWVYTVLSSGKMSTLHSSFFPQLTFTASKRRQTALNQMEQLHLKWQVPLFKDPALLSSPSPHPSAQCSERKTNSKFTIRIHLLGRYLFLPSSGWLFWLCSVVSNIQYAYFTDTFVRNKNKLSQCLCGNLATYILRDFSKKKSRQKKRRENKSILLSCIYESICLNIEKKCIC